MTWTRPAMRIPFSPDRQMAKPLVFAHGQQPDRVSPQSSPQDAIRVHAPDISHLKSLEIILSMAGKMPMNGAPGEMGLPNFDFSALQNVLNVSDCEGLVRIAVESAIVLPESILNGCAVAGSQH